MLDWLKRQFTGAGRSAGTGTYGHLVPGHRYVVAHAFADFDGRQHPAGETWTFLRHAFLPYEDGLTLFVRAPDGREDQVRLQARPESQGAIVDALEYYLVPEAPLGTFRIALTRDSVCMADDMDAPHSGNLQVQADADLAGIGHALLASRYLAYVGDSATWWMTAGDVAVVFGTRHWLSFVRSVPPGSPGPRASEIASLHVHYAAQQKAEAVVARLRSGG